MAEIHGRRLDSWKEIAAYLDRDVSTAMRWEKLAGMPVHRVPGVKRGRSVFCYTDELDRWILDEPLPDGPISSSVPGSGPSRAPDRDPNPAPASAPASAPAPTSVPRTGLSTPVAVLTGAVGVLLLVAVLAFGGWIDVDRARPSDSPGPADRSVASVDVSNHLIRAHEDTGRILWTYAHSNGYSFGDHPEAEVTDIEGDGRDDVLISVNTAIPARPDFLQGELYLFSQSGEMRWRQTLDDTYRFGETTFTAPWVSSSFRVLALSGNRRVAWVSNHYTWWPSVLTLTDSVGSSVGKFVNSGWMSQFNALVQPAGDLLLVGGISNSRGGAMLAVLDARSISGSSPEETGSEYECRDCPDGKPVRYFVFPPSEVNQATGLPYNETARIEVTEHQVNVVVREGGPGSDAAWIYEFSHDFELLRALPSDSYWPRHRALREEGKLDHVEDRCPERKRRDIRAWTPDRGWHRMTALP